jgi:hypothetical protein
VGPHRANRTRPPIADIERTSGTRAGMHTPILIVMRAGWRRVNFGIILWGRVPTLFSWTAEQSCKAQPPHRGFGVASVEAHLASCCLGQTIED